MGLAPMGAGDDDADLEVLAEGLHPLYLEVQTLLRPSLLLIPSVCCARPMLLLHSMVPLLLLFLFFATPYFIICAFGAYIWFHVVFIVQARMDLHGQDGCTWAVTEWCLRLLHVKMSKQVICVVETSTHTCCACTILTISIFHLLIE